MGDPKAHQAPFNVKSSESRSVESNSDPVDCSPSDSSAHGILQARILECVAFPFSRGFPNPAIKPGLLHCRRMLSQPSHQGRPRMVQWVACPSPAGLPDPGLKRGLLRHRRILHQLGYQHFRTLHTQCGSLGNSCSQNSSGNGGSELGEGFPGGSVEEFTFLG